MSSKRPVEGLLPESWKVLLPVFEGPLDLLLHLVKVNKVEISDIPVVKVCEQFHAYLRLMEELDLDIAGEYIYEASLLIQLKSRMLLPVATDEEGEPVEDPREELVQRLLEYRRIKEAAQSMAEVHGMRRGVLTRPKPPELAEITQERGEEAQIDLGDLSLFDLLGAFRGVLDRFDREHPPPLHLRGESFSVRDQFERWLERLRGGRPAHLADELSAVSCRAEAIAAFLAVLEMAKLGLLRLHQSDDGGVLLYRTTREVSAAELEMIPT